MSRPSDPIAFIARTHWLMGGVILFFAAMLYVLLRDSSVLELSRRTYGITLGLGVLYLVAGVLVWFGTPFGRVVNYVASFVYLARPPLGLRIWKIMRSEEYKAHFQRKPAPAVTAGSDGHRAAQDRAANGRPDARPRP